jgi:AraC-like DNA-binding protein
MEVYETVKTVATVVEPTLRLQVETAVGHEYRAVHTNSMREALRAVRERSVSAVFLSPRCVRRDELPRVATLVGGFPGVSTVAVVSRHDRTSSERLLELGAFGVRRMVDVTAYDGWRYLRELLSHPSSPTAARIFNKLIPTMGQPSEDCRTLFEAFVRLAPELSTVKEFTRRLNIHQSTFISRFHRTNLPSPKRYLVGIRLLYAAALLELPGLTLTDVAYRLQYSSPQSFGRHLRTVLGKTAGEFRARYGFAVAMDEFLERLVVPFRHEFSTFHPLDKGVGYLGQTRRSHGRDDQSLVVDRAVF